MNLLLDIARCEDVRKCLADPTSCHRCSSIVASQRKTLETLDDYQVPEPWSGHLDMAPILFLSSNPSISKEDAYPRWSWSNEEISCFFAKRFDGHWVKDGRHCLRNDRDGYHSDWVRYWAAIRGRAAELLGHSDARPGIDYVLSEVVHCKSKREMGVKAAVDVCAERYLARIVGQSVAKIIVGVGSVAARTIRHEFHIPAEVNVFGPVQCGGSTRYFTFLPAPSSYGGKTFADRLTAEELRLLQGCL